MPLAPDPTEARLRALEDHEAIRNLIASYGPMADCGNSAGVAALWAPDGIYAVGGLGEAKGREAIAALIDSPGHRQLMADGCAHMLGPVAIDVDGDRATARCYSVLLRHQGSSFEVYRVAANRWELARSEESWWVLRRDNALLDGSEAARALLSPPPARHPR